MASIVLTAVGQAAAPGLGGQLLGVVGEFAGGMVDRALFGTGRVRVVGPRLDNLKVQDSRYGTGVPMVYGRARVAGQVIWASDLIETRHEDRAGGGKGGSMAGGGSATVRYSYSVHAALALGRGPLARLLAVWADGKQIYDGLNWKSGILARASFYHGDAAQLPDPLLEAAEGSGNVPAYRGVAYLVLEGLQLADFGNRLPNITCEVAADDAAAAPVSGEALDPQLHNVAVGLADLNGMPPLRLSGTPQNARRMLVGGISDLSGTPRFKVIEYDVAADHPVEIAQTSSAALSWVGTLTSTAWALAPDGRFVAMIATVVNGPSTTNAMVIYDARLRQFGAISLVSLNNRARALAWLDALRFVVTDDSAGALGVRVLLRRGLDVVDGGFQPLWGAGSATTRQVLRCAQFVPYRGGVLALSGNLASNPTTLYACYLTWQQGGLQAMAPYSLPGSVPSGAGSDFELIALGNGEMLLCANAVDRVHVMSFIPTAAAATLTRPWQTLTLGIVSTDIAPCWFGTRLLLLQRDAIDNHYRLSEITLGDSSFALASDSIAINGAASGLYFQPVAIDYNRALVQTGDSYGAVVGEIFLLRRYAGGATVADVTDDLLASAGYAPAERNVTALAAATLEGYVLVPPVTARAALEPLTVFAPHDLVENDGVMTAVPRHGTTVTTLSAADLVTVGTASALQITRLPELELPREVTVDHIDPARDFEVGSQRARRIVTAARSHDKINLPIVCSADRAKQVAEARLFAAYAERAEYRMTLTRKHLALTPADVIALDGQVLRIRSLRHAGSVVDVTAVSQVHDALTSMATADGGGLTVPGALTSRGALSYLLDLPPLDDQHDQFGFYVAATGVAGFGGGALWRSPDDVDYDLLTPLPLPATAGVTVSSLAPASAFYPDRVNTIDVQLVDGTLASCSEEALLNGANAAFLGGEVIQFQTATLLAPGLYQLSQLLRARRGTEAMAHAPGEDFVLLQPATLRFVPLDATEINQPRFFRTPAVGQSLGDAAPLTKTITGRTLQPLAPTHLRGARDDGGDLAISWVRCVRVNAAWRDSVEVPLDETAELYDLEIMQGANVLRSFAGLTEPSVTYTAAQQTADWGALQSAVNVRVYQLGPRFGRGLAASGTL